MAPRRKPAPELQDQPEEVTPETEALTPAQAKPEDGAAAPETPDQLAALPGQPEATDAALSQEGGTAVAPEQDGPSLDAVERLLSERREEFREKLRVYNEGTGVAGNSYRPPRAFKLWETQFLGIENGAYKVRVVFDPTGRNLHNWTASRLVVVIVLLKIEGNDFEIVGHEDASG